MPTFRIETLGCKVNQYESLQMQQLLSDLGWHETACADADLVIVNTCAVTTAAAGKSRQLARKLVGRAAGQTIITGCWATADCQAAQALPGVTAVAGHGDDVAAVLRQLAGSKGANEEAAGGGNAFLPLLSTRQSANQRALLKVQDGCDAHCTYCIIPKLRPKLWSKPLPDAVEEARRLVSAGHLEIVLTGVFLGAYGQPTALHCRQSPSDLSLARLIDALCTQVPGLRRLRLSSLEPADVTDDLIAVMRSHPQVMPHFHLPLQSGSDPVLRRMNRQYSSADYLTMIQHLQAAFDHPAFTTDIITGFPGETEDAFAQTLQVARQAGFIHIHAFPYSPRPGAAATRWKDGLVPQRVANERVRLLEQLSAGQSLAFRQQFVGRVVNVLVEQLPGADQAAAHGLQMRHGRCERYFAVHFEAQDVQAGACVPVRIDHVTGQRTSGVISDERR
jgi:threonylcarbamoyladenosine tRNA methylthiotransferase MtaB